MPNTGNPLPIPCPKCQHESSLLIVHSLTVMTVRCANCDYIWATDLPKLPSEIQEKVRTVVNDHQ